MVFSNKIKILIFPAFIFFIYTLFIFFRLHSSSIGMYHKYFYGDKKDPNLIFSQPRAIRSDEWLVWTPKLISSVKNNFYPINQNIGFEENFVAQGFPVKHWRVIFHPNQWFFFFLPLEQAFSANWWFLSVLMILGVYFLFLILTKNIFLSIFSSLVFFFTPFNQWWSYLMSIYLSYGSFILIFFILILREKKLFKRIFYLFGITYFLLCFAFIQYPPFQVAVFYVIFFLALGLFIKNIKQFTKNDYLFFIFFFFFVFLASVFTLGKFYFEVKDVIEVVRNTVYPGKRFVADGQGSILHLLNGFYNLQLVSDLKGSAIYTNQSEASNFFLLSFFALPLYFWIAFNQIKNKKIDWLFLGLNIIFLVLLFWYLFPLSKILSKFSLFYLVPKKRVVIGIGICAYILMFYFLILKVKKDSFYSYLSIFLSFLTFFINLYLGFYFKYNYPVFIQNTYKIISISLLSGLLLYLLLAQHKKIFLILFFLFSFYSTYKVNPLYIGLDPILNTPLAKEIKKIAKETNNQYFFVNYGSIVLEDYPQANGAKSLSGVYYYPQFEWLKKLDPQKKYENIYNRYAHTNFFYNPEIKDKFVLWGGDNYGVNINPCDRFFIDMKAKYYLFNEKVNYKCLKLNKDIKMSNMNIFIYENLNI